MKRWKYLGKEIGTPIGIHDKNGEELCVGDTILFRDEYCTILWHSTMEDYEAFLARSLWYDNRDPYNEWDYGKSYPLHADDGQRMHIEKTK